jgi:hypothetical protein
MAGPAVNQAITHYQGDSLTITIGPVVDESGAAVDLNGATARWWMGKSAKATGTDVYIKKSSAIDAGRRERRHGQPDRYRAHLDR